MVKLPTAAKSTSRAKKEPQRDMYVGVRFFVIQCVDLHTFNTVGRVSVGKSFGNPSKLL